ncbi:MAG TPA: hypothetical protein VHE37_15205 [Nevskiaceae bacterium]|nr:hypothetical protein [Nevskiaceae bacterium]
MSKLVFMSQAHVARMNELLAADAASRAACAGLAHRWDMVYELQHGTHTVWWTMSFDPAYGVSFSLEAPRRAAQILFRGEYKAMLDWMRLRKAGGGETPEPVTMSGDSGGMSIIGPAYQAAAQAATLDTEIPQV